MKEKAQHIPWEPCWERECIGVQLGTDRKCLAHTNDRNRKAALSNLRDGTDLDFTRGVPITEDLLAEILDAAPSDADGNPILHSADFSRASFLGDADFRRAVLSGRTEFAATLFEGIANFQEAKFNTDANFHGAKFNGLARFKKAVFEGLVTFGLATFRGKAMFEEVSFHDVGFFGTQFLNDSTFLDARIGYIVLDRAHFEGLATFSGATFENAAGFRDTIFEEAAFDEGVFNDGADFRGVTFRFETSFHQTKFNGYVDFNDASFEALAAFREAIFQAETDFSETRFSKEARFRGAIFAYDGSFTGATFGGLANFDNATFVAAADFRGTIFGAGTSFSDTRFQGDGRFHNATFGETPHFANARIERDMFFDGAKFESRAGFGETLFRGVAHFKGAVFTDVSDFSQSIFEQEAKFDEAEFIEDALFARASFEETISFVGTRFIGKALFDGTSFKGWARFHDVTFEGSLASFESAAFDSVAELGPMSVDGILRLDGATFGLRVQIDVRALEISCVRSRFLGGGQLRFNHAEIILAEAEFPNPFLITGSGEGSVTRLPTILSMEGADVAGLSLTSVDLRACRFLGSHNLDRLRIAGPTFFGNPPVGLQMGRAVPPLWRWGRRQVLAEEQEWRARPGYPKRTHWYPSDCHSRGWAGASPQLMPLEIAALYRSLRKSREDAKDEPGAADFYYGEMEMRRKLETSPVGERLLLWLYWATSGYGLRASRALLTLVGVVVVFAWLLQLHGFADPQPFVRALTYTAASGTAILGGMERALTTWGEALRIALRIITPVLIGLTLVSLRGRVKR